MTDETDTLQGYDFVDFGEVEPALWAQIMAEFSRLHTALMDNPYQLRDLPLRAFGALGDIATWVGLEPARRTELNVDITDIHASCDVENGRHGSYVAVRGSYTVTAIDYVSAAGTHGHLARAGVPGWRQCRLEKRAAPRHVCGVDCSTDNDESQR